ncbi:MAG: TRAP transporter small permease [Burkholderiales bacterium]|nr:TRAP transporter small permease [Burkholderiales bacterium]
MLPGPDRGWLAQIERAVNATLRIVACALLLALCAAMALQVFQRFVVGRSLDWPDELAPTLLVWISLVGAALASRENEHIGFAILLERLPPKARAALSLFNCAVIVTLLVVFVVYSLPLISRTWGQMMTTVPVSRGLIYTILPVTSIIMIGYALRHSPVGDWYRRRRPARAVVASDRPE